MRQTKISVFVQIANISKKKIVNKILKRVNKKYPTTVGKLQACSPKFLKI